MTAQQQILLVGSTAVSGILPPLDGTSPTGAWSFSRKLLTAYGGSYYADVSGAITTLYDQSGNAGSRNLVDKGNVAVRPVLTTAGPNSRAAANFDGSTDVLEVQTLSNFFAASSGYAVVSAIVTSISTNTATSYTNDTLIGDVGQYMGLYLRNLAGGTVYAYNYDGSEDVATTTFSTGVPIVFTWRHEGGNLYVSVNGGTEVSVASGNTQNLATAFRLCGGQAFSDSTVFELATWSTVPNGTARTAIVADFKTWVGA